MERDTDIHHSPQQQPRLETGSQHWLSLHIAHERLKELVPHIVIPAEANMATITAYIDAAERGEY